MSKQQKKKAKPRVLEPMAVLYRLDKETPRGSALRAVLAAQNIRVKTVTPEHLGDPVGFLAGLQGFHQARAPYSGTVPDVEFMLLCHLPAAKMTELLSTLRENGLVIERKAQLTQHNRLWPFATLVNEVSREHESMSGNAQ